MQHVVEMPQNDGLTLLEASRSVNVHLVGQLDGCLRCCHASGISSATFIPLVCSSSAPAAMQDLQSGHSEQSAASHLLCGEGLQTGHEQSENESALSQWLQSAIPTNVHKQLTSPVLLQFHDSKLLLETCGMAKDSFNKIVTLFFLGEPLLHCKACMLMQISSSSLSSASSMACHLAQLDGVLCSLQTDPANRLLP